MRRATFLAALLALSASGAGAAEPAVPPVSYALPPERIGEPVFVGESRGGLYLGTVSGVNLIGTTRSRFDTPARSLLVRTEYEAAAYAAGRLGYAFDPLLGSIHPRVEAEIGYASNSVDRYRIGAFASASGDSFGEARALQGYANAFFDINVGLPVRPYVGGGVGVADVRLRRQGVSATGVAVDSSDAAFAYHLDAGVGVDLSRFGGSPLLKGTTVELGYRWTHAPELRFTARDGSALKSEYQSNMVTFGTRKAF